MNTPAAESVYRFFEERRKAVEESLSGPKA